MDNIGIQILVVDDEPAVALAVKSSLKFVGYTVIAVAGGQAALDAVQAEPERFSLVLSDHNMPGINGLALVKGLRKLEYAGHVVILSAFISHEIEGKYRELGVDQILSKPFSIEELRVAVAQVLHPVGAGS